MAWTPLFPRPPLFSHSVNPPPYTSVWSSTWTPNSSLWPSNSCIIWPNVFFPPQFPPSHQEPYKLQAGRILPCEFLPRHKQGYASEVSAVWTKYWVQTCPMGSVLPFIVNSSSQFLSPETLKASHFPQQLPRMQSLSTAKVGHRLPKRWGLSMVVRWFSNIFKNNTQKDKQNWMVWGSFCPSTLTPLPKRGYHSPNTFPLYHFSSCFSLILHIHLWVS